MLTVSRVSSYFDTLLSSMIIDHIVAVMTCSEVSCDGSLNGSISMIAAGYIICVKLSFFTSPDVKLFAKPIPFAIVAMIPITAKTVSTTPSTVYRRFFFGVSVTVSASELSTCSLL